MVPERRDERPGWASMAEDTSLEPRRLPGLVKRTGRSCVIDEREAYPWTAGGHPVGVRAGPPRIGRVPNTVRAWQVPHRSHPVGPAGWSAWQPGDGTVNGRARLDPRQATNGRAACLVIVVDGVVIPAAPGRAGGTPSFRRRHGSAGHGLSALNNSALLRAASLFRALLDDQFPGRGLSVSQDVRGGRP